MATTLRNLWGRSGLVAIATALSLVAASCASDSPDSSDEQSAGTPVKGGTLRVAIPSGISGFDPLRIAGPIDDIVAETGVYDTLMNFDEVGGEPAPMLALSAIPNADYTEWTVELREGVTFHDGTLFDAEAVKFNFDRQLDPANGASAAAILTPLESVEVVDESTVQFNTKFPWPNLPYLLTFPPSIMASPAAIEQYGEDYTNHPVGTGPYRLESQTAGSEYVLTRNEDYWNKDNAAYADKIEFRVISNESSAYQSLLSGDIDMMASLGTETISKASGQSNVTVSQCPSTAATALVLPFNLSKPPFDDVRVRLALNYAIDRDAIAEGLFGGLVDGSDGPFAGSRWDNGVEYPGYDLDRAQELMDEYLADGGEPVHITITAGQGSPVPAVLQDMWSEIGVTTEIAEVDVPTLITSLIQKQFDVLTWSSSIYPHPDFVFYAFNVSSSPLVLDATGDPTVDAALDAARSAADIDVQKEQYRIVDDYHAEQSPWVWVTNGLQAWAYSDKVHGKLQPEFARATCVPYVPGAWLSE